MRIIKISNLCILKSFHTIYELIILEYHMRYKSWAAVNEQIDWKA